MKKKHAGTTIIREVEAAEPAEVHGPVTAPAYYVEARMRNGSSSGAWLGADKVFVGGRHKHFSLREAQREIDVRMKHPRIVMGGWELRLRPGAE